jgi:hypothetical protein
MYVDNYDLIKPFLKFNNEDDFYYLQILRRRKDNPEDQEKNTTTIKDYYIRSVDYLESKMDEIKNLCVFFNARASIRLNRRSFKKVAFRALNNITAQMMQEDFHSARQAYSKAAGQCHNDNEKKWIVDIDTDMLDQEYEIMEYINCECQPNDDDEKFYTKIPTKSGIHLISKPFNMDTFKKKYPNIDVHRDNPTILFCIK